LKEPKQIITAIIILLTIITATFLIQYKLNTGEYSGNYEITIWTDKETYTLEEPIHTVLVFTNKADHQIDIKPIYKFSFSGNSIHDPHPVTGEIHNTYGEEKISIPANGNISFIESTFNPTYPGPFKITGLGVSKTVNVTGYQEVRINSTGIKLILEPSKTVLKDRDYVEFKLVILNENPYPVKIPVFSPVFMGFDPDEMMPSIFLDWIYSHFEIESNSRWVLSLRGYLVRYPVFKLYVSVEDVMVSFEMDVEK